MNMLILKQTDSETDMLISSETNFYDYPIHAINRKNYMKRIGGRFSIIPIEEYQFQTKNSESDINIVCDIQMILN